MSRPRIPDELVFEAGLAAMTAGEFTMSEVARRAGVTRQALHLRFDGLADLAVQVARYSDRQLDVGGEFEPVRAATTGPELLFELAAFHGRFNPKIAPIVLAAQAAARRHPELWAPLEDRRRARVSAATVVARSLKTWGCLSDAWSVDAAALWMVSMGSIPLWWEQVQLAGWTTDAYVARLERSLRCTLLG